MMYLLYGSDTEKSRAKLKELVEKMLAKKPDATHAVLTEENVAEYSFDELIGGMGLFSSKLIIECNQLLKSKEAKALITDNIKEIAQSDNIFIFREGPLLKGELKIFEKHAEKIQKFDLAEAPTKRDTTFFTIADAFGNHDRKQLWVLFSKAMMADAAPEEIHGIIFWQVKSMLLAQASGSAEAAGLNPFVYQKSKRFAQNFPQNELTQISDRLVTMYHEARRGIVDFAATLEQFILEV